MIALKLSVPPSQALVWWLSFSGIKKKKKKKKKQLIYREKSIRANSQM